MILGRDGWQSKNWIDVALTWPIHMSDEGKSRRMLNKQLDMAIAGKCIQNIVVSF